MSTFTGKTSPGIPQIPERFRPADSISFSRFEAIAPSFSARKQRVQGARAAGIRYEKKIHAELLKLYPKWYLPSPWFRFADKYGMRWCQPDGLLIDPAQGQILILEMKHHHTGEAWWKLKKLYLPVVKHFFGENWTYRLVEIVRFYDSDEIFPDAKLCEFIHFAPQLPKIGVHILKPKEQK